MAILLFGLLFLFFIIGVPIAFSLQLTGAFFLSITDLKPLILVAQRMVRGMDSFTVLACPLFIVAGYIMESTSISQRLIDCIACYFGRFRGSMGIVTILACTIFAALTGSGVATVAAIGAVMMPALLETGYPRHSAAGLLAAGGALGPVIPPSIPMIVYGATMNVSIPAMFIGGVIPGLLIAAVLIAMNQILVKKWEIKKVVKSYSVRETLKLSWKALGALFMPILILGGIYGGIFTPTEAAAVAVIYGLVLGVFYKDLNLKVLYGVLKRSVETSAKVIFILAQANLFAWILSTTRIPQKITESLVPLISTPAVYLLILTAILFVVGTLMETIASIVILAPILVPVGVALGIDPLHLAVVFCINLVVGYVTPPFGVNLFAAVSTTGQSYVNVVKGVLPFLIAEMATVVTIAFLPVLTTWLPGLVFH